MSRPRSTGQPHLPNDFQSLLIRQRPSHDPNPITAQVGDIHDSVRPLERLMRMGSFLSSLVRSGVRVGKGKAQQGRVGDEEGRGECCECSGGCGGEVSGLRIDRVEDGRAAAVLWSGQPSPRCGPVDSRWSRSLHFHP